MALFGISSKLPGQVTASISAQLHNSSQLHRLIFLTYHLEQITQSLCKLSIVTITVQRKKWSKSPVSWSMITWSYCSMLLGKTVHWLGFNCTQLPVWEEIGVVDFSPKPFGPAYSCWRNNEGASYGWIASSAIRETVIEVGYHWQINCGTM